MGCTEANANLPFEMMILSVESQKNLEDFQLLQLSTKEVRSLYNMYDFISGAEGSQCSLYNFVNFVGISPTAFTQQVLALYSEETFDFRAFVLAIWNYCTLTSKNMHLFVFDLYNVYGKPLTPPEVISMLRDVYGAHKWKTNAFAHSTFKELCKAEEVKEDFTMNSFHTFMLNHKYLLIPAFQLQRTLREKICGRGFWRRQTERRERLHPVASYVSIAQLLNPGHRYISDYYASTGRLIPQAPRSTRSTGRRKKQRPKSAPASTTSAFSLSPQRLVMSKDLVQDLQDLST